MTTLSTTLSAVIDAHGCRNYPEECVGALIGSYDRSSVSFSVEQLLPLDNSSKENKQRRFSIAPTEYMAAEKAATAAGKRLIGFYHSHPDHPARPSATDLSFAMPHFVYIIVSIQGEEGAPRARDVGAFILDHTDAEFTRDELVRGD